MAENKGTVYELIASHGDVEDMIFFAVLMQGKSCSRLIVFQVSLDSR